MKMCTQPECGRDVAAKGLCWKHYDRQRQATIRARGIAPKSKMKAVEPEEIESEESFRAFMAECNAYAESVVAKCIKAMDDLDDEFLIERFGDSVVRSAKTRLEGTGRLQARQRALSMGKDAFANIPTSAFPISGPWGSR